MNQGKFRSIIWDWNGTLLNDVDICVRSMNVLLERRKLPILDAERYRKAFTFPVKDYYEEIGFDFLQEPFEIPALEFIDEYRQSLPEARLAPDAVRVLDSFRTKGFRQFVLSAMEQESLVKSILSMGIHDCFELIMGTDDHYAHGKEVAAKTLADKSGLENRHTLLIGDTLHDSEVAEHLGIECFLISSGHQSRERLLATGRPVFSSLSELLIVL